MIRLKKIKKLFAGALLSALLAVSLVAAAKPVPALADEGWPSGVSVSAEGACVMDADSKTILYGKNADTAYFPASITKVMTALLVIENCPDLSEIVTFSREAVELGEDNATVIGASAGDQLSVQDCLYSLLFKSANEVANALAEHVGAKFPERKDAGMSDRDVFVAMMNEKAASLDCTNTHFDNPSGLTDPEHYTTAHDMCLILAAAIENETFLDIESRTYWTHGPIKRYPDPNDPWNTVYQSHRMIRKNSYYYYPGVFAGKTGFTTTAGNTLVTACKKDGMTLVVTVLNGHMTHYEDTERLLDFGYDNFHSLPVTDYDTSAQAVQDDLSVMGLPVADTVALAVDDASRVTLPKDVEFDAVQSALSFELTQNDPADAVAKMQYSYNGREVGSAYLRSRVRGQRDRITAAEQDPLYQALAESSAPEQLEGAAGENSGAAPAGALTGTGADGAVPGEGSEANGENSPAAGSGSTGNGEQGAFSENGAAGTAGEAAAGMETNGAPAGGLIGPDGSLYLFGLQISPRVLFVLKAAGAAVLLLLAGAYFLLRAEKREAQQRARRRAQRLKHTRDLTGSQNIKMDLMVQQSLRRKRSRRRKKRF